MKHIKIYTTFIISISLLSNIAFAQIPESHWFNTIVPIVNEKGFYNSINEDSFNPDDDITYNEFAKASTLAIGRAIAYDGSKANESIKRVDILKILNERLGYKLTDLTEEQQIQAAINISDFNDMNQDDKNIVLASYANNLIKGDEDGQVRPQDSATFAEALTILNRVSQ